MRSRVIVSCAVLAAVASLALYRVRSSSAPAGAAPAATSAGAGRAELEAPRALEHEPASAPVAGAPLAASREALLPAPDAPPGQVRVRVVREETGAPLPGASLWIEREEVDRKGAAWTLAMRRCNDVEPLLAGAFGRAVPLDEHGEALVPRPPRSLLVAAAQGSLHGEGKLRPEEEAILVVELRPYRSLVCEVVDREGRPVADAQVAFAWGSFDPYESEWSFPTDGEGRLRLAKLDDQIWLKDYRGALRVSLALGVPCEPQQVVLDTDALPDEPVRLASTGASARLTVQAVDRAGAPFDTGGSVYLSLDSFGIPSDERPLGDALVSQRLDRGRAVLSCVPAGRPLDLYVSAEGREDVSRSVLLDEGEERTIAVPVGPRRLRARGRLVGMQALGDPEADRWCIEGRLGDQPLLHAWFSEASFDRPLWRSPDEMEAILSASGPSAPWTLRVVRIGGPEALAVATPRYDRDEALLDFGEVCLEARTALGHVLVVDDRGKPATQAEILISGSERLLYADDEGRFLVSGTLADLPLEVKASRNGWLESEPGRLEALGDEITLALRSGAALEGRLLLASADIDSLWATLTIATRAGEDELDAEVVEGGRFRFLACPEGTAALEVRYWDQPVLRREGLVLRAGETTQVELDLREQLFPFALSFELASMAPWQGGYVEVLGPDGPFAGRTIGPSARAVFYAPEPLTTLWVVARGGRLTRYENVRDGDRVVVPEGIEALVRLDPGLPLPAGLFLLMVQARFLGDDPLLFGWIEGSESVAVQPDGTARLCLPCPGRYALHWLVRRTDTDTDTAVEDFLEAFEIEASQERPTIEATLAADQLALALRAAGG